MRQRFISIVFICSVLLMGCAATSPSQAASPDVKELTAAYFRNFPADGNILRADTLFAMMRDGEHMFIIDIRAPKDYAESHLKGAVNLPFADTSIADALERIPNDRPVMVYCATGQTSAQVAVLLNIAGKNAKSVQSGFNNAIMKTKREAALLERKSNALPDAAYPVDAGIKVAVMVYFQEKMRMNGTPFTGLTVTPETVKGIVDAKNDGYLIVSVRRPADYAKEHIPTARNIPFGKGMEKGLMQLPADKKIIVYCYTGQTAAQTMAALRMMGYDAYSMSGGMTAWNKAKYAVTGE